MVTLPRTVSTSSRAMSAERVVAKDLNRTVVGFERVVEGELVLRQPEFVTAGVGLPHLAGKLDQLLYHLRGLDGPVLVATEGLLQHLGERPVLHDVLSPAGRQALP